MLRARDSTARPCQCEPEHTARILPVRLVSASPNRASTSLASCRVPARNQAAIMDVFRGALA
eukprot:3637428-Pleurochrysis_carterae.AAC.1